MSLRYISILTKKSWAMVVLAACLLTVTSSAQAQNKETAFQIQQFRPWLDSNGMFQTQAGTTIGQWMYSVGLFFNYAKDPLSLRNEQGQRWPNGQIIQHQVSSDLVAAVGLLNILEVGLRIPMTLYQSGEISSQNSGFFEDSRSRDLSGFAFSDMMFAVKVQALKEKKHWLNLGFQVYLGIPTGNEDNFNGEDTVSFGLSALMNKHFGKFNVGLNLGYRFLPHTKALNLIINHEIFYSLAASFNIIQNKLQAIADLSGATALSSETSVESAPFELYMGARYYPMKRTDLALSLGLGVPFMPGYGTPQIRCLFAISFTPANGFGVQRSAPAPQSAPLPKPVKTSSQ